MSKVKIQCTNCGKKYKTEHPEIIMRFCKNCNQETEFSPVEKEQKPITKRQPATLLCRYCCRSSYIPTGRIPSECPQCHYKVDRPLDEGIMDTILRLLTGGNETKKWFLKVDVSRDGTLWWTPEKDAPDDDIVPFIGDAQRTGSYHIKER